MSDYDEPDESGGNRMYPVNLVNHLLLVWAVGHIPHSPTQYSRPDKPSDVIVVDVVDLDMADENTGIAGLVGRKCWWRQGRLIADLKGKIGRPKPMLVRMTKGPATVGQQPYVIVSQSQDAAACRRADAWRERNPDFVPSTFDQPQSQPQAFTGEPATAEDSRSARGDQPAWSTPAAVPPGGSHWDAPEESYLRQRTHPANMPPAAPPPQPVPVQQETPLERMKRLAGAVDPADPTVTGF